MNGGRSLRRGDYNVLLASQVYARGNWAEGESPLDQQTWNLEKGDALAAEIDAFLTAIRTDTWINDRIIQLFTELHEAGLAHSVALGAPATSAFGRVAWLTAQSRLPSICVPAGFSKAGVPVGMEMIAPPYREPDLIRLGYSFEQATHWRRPPASTPPL